MGLDEYGLTYNNMRQSSWNTVPRLTTVIEYSGEYIFILNLKKYFFLPPMAPHVLMNFVVFPPVCGESVTDFWGWDAHEAQFRCPDGVSGDILEDEMPGGALCLSLLTTQTTGNLHPQGKIPMVEPGIETGTSWLVVRNPDH
jgi:hypothetical protein